MAGGSGRNIFSELIVGFFMLIVAAALIIFTALTAGMDMFTGKGRQHMAFHFSDVAGLRAQDSVVMRGMPIGKVRRLTLVPDGVHVEILADQRLQLNEGYLATVRANSLLGGNHLLLVQGGGDALPHDEETVYTGTPPTDWLADLNDTIAEIRGVIRRVDGEKVASIIADVGATTRSLSNIVSRVEAGEGTLGKLLSADDTVYEDLSATLENLREVSQNLSSGDGSIARLLADDGTLYHSLSNTLGNINAVSARLESGDGTLGKLLSPDDTLYTNLLDASTGLKDLVAKIDSGDGTLGKLATDPTLYNEVEGLILDARSTLDNFRETTPITSFGSLLVGGL